MKPAFSLSAALGQPRVWFWSWVGWFAVLFLFSSLPGSGIKFSPWPHFDKIEHALYFFAGGVLVGGWLISQSRWPRSAWIVPLTSALVGAFDEWHQKFSPGRSALDFADWSADFIGGTFALLPLIWLARFIVALQPTKAAG